MSGGKGRKGGAAVPRIEKTYGALDIGSSKICCIIGRLKPCAESERLPGRTHQVRVIGIGLHAAAAGPTWLVADAAGIHVAPVDGGAGVRVTITG